MTPPTTMLAERWKALPEEVRTEALAGGWYRESRKVARAMARDHNVTLSVAAGVIAALSPRQRWATNVGGADSMLAGGPGVGFRANIAKAQRIIDGERPWSVLGGPKVRAFYEAIMGDTDAAVVDVWMWRAMGLMPGELSYAEAEAALREAAKIAGLPVANFQAIIWTDIRGGGA